MVLPAGHRGKQEVDTRWEAPGLLEVPVHIAVELAAVELVSGVLALEVPRLPEVLHIRDRTRFPQRPQNHS